jgi:DNA-binding MarR family transcriptional regulator
MSSEAAKPDAKNPLGPGARVPPRRPGDSGHGGDAGDGAPARGPAGALAPGPRVLRRFEQDAKLRAWLAFLTSYRAVLDRLEDELLEKRGMSLSWFDVLAQLARAGGRLRMNRLAASLVLSKSGLTRRIDRMEAAGFVTRESAPSDRRGAYAVLTDAGLEALAAAQQVHLEGIEEHFSRHLSDSAAATLEKVLALIAEAAAKPTDAC